MITLANATFNWEDPLLLDRLLSDDERAVRDAAAAYAQERLAPHLPDTEMAEFNRFVERMTTQIEQVTSMIQ